MQHACVDAAAQDPRLEQFVAALVGAGAASAGAGAGAGATCAAPIRAVSVAVLLLCAAVAAVVAAVAPDPPLDGARGEVKRFRRPSTAERVVDCLRDNAPFQ